MGCLKSEYDLRARPRPLLERGPGPAQAFARRAVFPRLQAALARGRARLGRAARTRRDRGAPDQLHQTRARVIAVALLRAMALRVDHQHALAGEPPAGEPLEPRAHGLGQARRAAHVEAQLHRARKLVDVLPAAPPGPHAVLLAPPPA